MAAFVLHFVPTVLVAWVAALGYVFNEEADHNETIGHYKKTLLERMDPLLSIAGFKKSE